MNCAWVQERLLLYLAGELDARQTARLVRHLETCAPCAAMAESLAETAARAEAALPLTIEAPATLDARVMEAVRGLPIPRRTWPALLPRRRVLRRLALGAAMLIMMIGSFLAGGWNATRGHRVAPLDLARLGEAHRQSLQSAATPEVSTDQPQQLTRALTPLLSFPVAAVDLRADGMRLVGGSRATIDGVPLAALNYEWNRQRISLYEVDSRQLSPQALRQVVFGSDSYFVRRMGGLTYVAWSLGRTNCVMVARAVPMHILFRLACHAGEKLEHA